MRDVDKHLKQEYEDWEKVQAKELTKLNAAMRHLCLNVGAYFLISIIEWILASISHRHNGRCFQQFIRNHFDLVTNDRDPYCPRY